MLAKGGNQPKAKTRSAGSHNNSSSTTKQNNQQQSGAHLQQGKRQFPLSIKLRDTGEVFQLDGIKQTMTIRELKSYLEFATGIPKSIQQIHYLDEGDLLDHTDIRSNDIVPGGQLHMTIWHTWIPLVKAVTQNNINQVLRLGVTADSDVSTPNSDYMSAKARQVWLAERAFVALFVACHRGNTALVRTIIESGANVNMKSSLGRTALHVAAAQGKGPIVDLLLNSGADVNEVDEIGDSALAIAERFGHKDGARHLFLFRWQVRAAQAQKVPEVPPYFHQQCDTANPVWLSGTQNHEIVYSSPAHQSLQQFPPPQQSITPEGQVYFSSGLPDGAFNGTGQPAPNKPIDLPPESRVKQKIEYDAWLGEKKRIEQITVDQVKAEKAVKKLEEEKKKEQTLIDKESFDTWVKKQNEEKEKSEQRRKLLKQQNKAAAAERKAQAAGGNNKNTGATNTPRDALQEGPSDKSVEELQAYIRTHKKGAAKYDELLFGNDDETFEKVKTQTLKRAAGKNQTIAPTLG